MLPLLFLLKPRDPVAKNLPFPDTRDVGTSSPQPDLEQHREWKKSYNSRYKHSSIFPFKPSSVLVEKYLGGYQRELSWLDDEKLQLWYSSTEYMVWGLSCLWQCHWLSTHNGQWTELQEERKGKVCLRGRDVEGRRPGSSFLFPWCSNWRGNSKAVQLSNQEPWLGALMTSVCLCLWDREVLWITQHHQARREFSQDSY